MDGVSLPTWDIHNDHDIGMFSKNAVILETNRLMYGVHDGNGSKRDITIGPVDAVHFPLVSRLTRNAQIGYNTKIFCDCNRVSKLF